VYCGPGVEQEMPAGLKERNARPRAVGDPADKAAKKRLQAMSDEPTVGRLPHAALASVHIRQLMDLAYARVHKSRAFVEVLRRLPAITTRAGREATFQLDERRQQCRLPAPERPAVCSGGSRVWKRRAD